MGAMLSITIGEQSYRAHGALLQTFPSARGSCAARRAHTHW